MRINKSKDITFYPSTDSNKEIRDKFPELNNVQLENSEVFNGVKLPEITSITVEKLIQFYTDIADSKEGNTKVFRATALFLEEYRKSRTTK